MAKALQRKRLEEELETLRQKLYQLVSGEPTRLTDQGVLPMSEQLDVLIVQMQKELRKTAF